MNSTDARFTYIERYRRIVGRLLCLTMTRSNIAYSVKTLSHFVHDPKQSHMDAAIRVIGMSKKIQVKGCFSIQIISLIQ